MLSPDRPVALAAIIGAHGVAGEVRLKLLGEGLDGFRLHKSFNAGALTLKSVRANKGGAIARFAEIADRNAAEAARGKQLCVPRSALPPLEAGEYYHVDVVGLAAFTDAGVTVGEVVAVENFGAGDLAEIAPAKAKPFLVPMKLCRFDAEKFVLPADFLPDAE